MSQDLDETLTSDENEQRRLSSTLHRVARTAQELLGADSCLLFTINPIMRSFIEPPTVVGELASISLSDLAMISPSDAVIAIEEHGPIFVTDRASEPDNPSPMPALDMIRAYSAITLRTEHNHKLMALIFLIYNQPRQFTNDYQHQLQVFAAAATPVLQNFWLLSRYRQVARIGQEINLGLENNIESLFEQLHTNISQIIGSTYFLLAIYQPQSLTLDYYTFEKNQATVDKDKALRGGCAWVIENQELLQIQDFSKEQAAGQLPAELIVIPSPHPELPQSGIFVPLSFRDVPLGVLSAQHHQPHFYDGDDVHVLSLLSNHIALALSNIRLFERVRQLSENGQFLTQRLTEEDVLQNVVDQIRDATKADLVLLYPYQQHESLFDSHPHISGVLLQPDHPRFTPSRRDDVALLTLQQPDAVFVKNSVDLYTMLKGDPRDRQGNFEQREQIRSTVAVPLRVVGENVGVLFINFRQPQRFDDSEKLFIRGLGSYAAIGIKNWRELDALSQRRVEELETLQQINREISKSLDVETVMYSILQQASQRIKKAEEASIALINPRTGKLESKAAFGRNADRRRQQVARWIDEKGITRWVFEHGVPARTGNVRTDPKWSDMYVEVSGDIFSELDVPLKDGSEVIGVINFESTQLDAFSKPDEDFLGTLAEQAVLAIKNAQSYDRLQALHKIDREIIRQLDDVEAVLKLVLELVLRSTVADVAELYLYEDDRVHTTYITRYDKQRRGMFFSKEEAIALPLDTKQGIVNYVAKERVPYRTKGDAQSDQFYIGSTDIHSEIAYPLVADDKLIGVLNLESHSTNLFDDDDIDTLTVFASQMIIGFQNARNYTLANLERQRFMLLSTAGQRLGAITDISQLEQAYKIVLDIAEQHLHSQVVIRRLDEETHELVRVAAARDRGILPFERISLDMGANGFVARHQRRVVFDDVLEPHPEDVQAQPSDPETRSLVVTPIKFGQRYYGNIGLSHEKPRYFVVADLDLIDGLSYQLAITLHRLETVQAQKEAEQRAREAEIISSMGQGGMELAHRLGNDLGLVRRYVNKIRSLLRSQGVNMADVEEYLNNILRDVGKVNFLGKRLKQDFATFQQAGKLNHNPTIVPVQAVLDEAIQSFPPPPPRIQMEYDIADDLGSISVDVQHIVDILNNLVMNAIDAMPDGGRITIKARNVGRLVALEVVDTGFGIPPERQPYIFNLFFSTKGSSGFGLWSARRNALANGGELTVRSQPGQGTVFRLRLPRHTTPLEP